MRNYFLFCYIALRVVSAYQDEELSCNYGYAVAFLLRNSAEENGAITGTCRPIVNGVSKLQNSQCHRRRPLQCTNDWENGACGANEWLAGLRAYQLKTTRANLLVPVCCSSPHVQLFNDSCRTYRLNAFLQPFRYRVEPGNVITRMKCNYIADQGKSVLDVTLHFEVCSYQVDGVRPFGKSLIKSELRSSAPTKFEESESNDSDYSDEV